MYWFTQAWQRNIYIYYKQSINQNKHKMQYKKYKITKYLTTYYNKKINC